MFMWLLIAGLYAFLMQGMDIPLVSITDFDSYEALTLEQPFSDTYIQARSAVLSSASSIQEIRQGLQNLKALADHTHFSPAQLMFGKLLYGMNKHNEAWEYWCRAVKNGNAEAQLRLDLWFMKAHAQRLIESSHGDNFIFHHPITLSSLNVIEKEYGKGPEFDPEVLSKVTTAYEELAQRITIAETIKNKKLSAASPVFVPRQTSLGVREQNNEDSPKTVSPDLGESTPKSNMVEEKKNKPQKKVLKKKRQNTSKMPILAESSPSEPPIFEEKKEEKTALEYLLDKKDLPGLENFIEGHADIPQSLTAHEREELERCIKAHGWQRLAFLYARRLFNQGIPAITFFEIAQHTQEKAWWFLQCARLKSGQRDVVMSGLEALAFDRLSGGKLCPDEVRNELKNCLALVENNTSFSFKSSLIVAKIYERKNLVFLHDDDKVAHAILVAAALGNAEAQQELVVRSLKEIQIYGHKRKLYDESYLKYFDVVVATCSSATALEIKNIVVELIKKDSLSLHNAYRHAKSFFIKNLEYAWEIIEACEDQLLQKTVEKPKQATQESVLISSLGILYELEKFVEDGRLKMPLFFQFLLRRIEGKLSWIKGDRSCIKLYAYTLPLLEKNSFDDTDRMKTLWLEYATLLYHSDQKANSFEIVEMKLKDVLKAQILYGSLLLEGFGGMERVNEGLVFLRSQNKKNPEVRKALIDVWYSLTSCNKNTPLISHVRKELISCLELDEQFERAEVIHKDFSYYTSEERAEIEKQNRVQRGLNDSTDYHDIQEDMQNEFASFESIQSLYEEADRNMELIHKKLNILFMKMSLSKNEFLKYKLFKNALVGFWNRLFFDGHHFAGYMLGKYYLYAWEYEGDNEALKSGIDWYLKVENSIAENQREDLRMMIIDEGAFGLLDRHCRDNNHIKLLLATIHATRYKAHLPFFVDPAYHENYAMLLYLSVIDHLKGEEKQRIQEEAIDLLCDHAARYAKMSDLAQAKRFLDRAFKINPEHPRTLYEHARFYLNYGVAYFSNAPKVHGDVIWRKAHSYFQKAIERGNVDARCMLAELYFLGHQIDTFHVNADKKRARALLKPLCDQDNLRALSVLGTYYYNNQKFKKALNLIHDFIDKDRGLTLLAALAHYKLYSEEKSPDSGLHAYRLFESLLDSTQDLPLIYLHLGLLGKDGLGGADSFQKSLDYFAKYLETLIELSSYFMLDDKNVNNVILQLTANPAAHDDQMIAYIKALYNHLAFSVDCLVGGIVSTNKKCLQDLEECLSHAYSDERKIRLRLVIIRSYLLLAISVQKINQHVGNTKNEEVNALVKQAVNKLLEVFKLAFEGKHLKYPFLRIQYKEMLVLLNGLLSKDKDLKLFVDIIEKAYALKN